VILGVLATAVFIFGPVDTLFSAKAASIYDASLSDRLCLIAHVCVSSHVYLLSERLMYFFSLSRVSSFDLHEWFGFVQELLLLFVLIS
jgi:hypothetical protein